MSQSLNSTVNSDVDNLKKSVEMEIVNFDGENFFVLSLPLSNILFTLSKISLEQNVTVLERPFPADVDILK